MEQTRLSVRVHPGAGRNEITGFAEDVLRVKIAAPPEKGKANRELVIYLSEKLGIERARVEVLSGQTGRSKVVSISGLDAAEVWKRLGVAPRASKTPPASRRLL